MTNAPGILRSRVAKMASLALASSARCPSVVFVVDSVGFNDKTWIDFFGNPHSEEMHLIERCNRVNHDTLTMQLIIDDPKAYTKTWVGDIKVYTLLPPNEAFMSENFCVPSEEAAFKKGVREPATGLPSK